MALNCKEDVNSGAVNRVGMSIRHRKREICNNSLSFMVREPGCGMGAEQLPLLLSPGDAHLIRR